MSTRTYLRVVVVVGRERGVKFMAKQYEAKNDPSVNFSSRLYSEKRPPKYNAPILKRLIPGCKPERLA